MNSQKPAGNSSRPTPFFLLGAYDAARVPTLVEALGQAGFNASKTALITDVTGDEAISAGLRRHFGSVIELAQSCPCCGGFLPLRTALIRELRRKPAALVVLLSPVTHRESVEKGLNDPSLADHLDRRVLP